jgi:hypothetical protein
MQRTSYAPLSPATACRFEVREDKLVCQNCGLKVKASLFPKGKPFVACTKPSPIPVAPPAQEVGRGLGDMVSDSLSSVGVTKELAQSVAARLGVKDCGCGKRQKWLNAAGSKWLGLPPGKPIDSQ